jgi:hypothetical protein
MRTLKSMVDAQDPDDVVHLDAVTRVLTHEDFTPACADFLTVSELVAAAMRCSPPSNSPLDYLQWRLALDANSAELLRMAWSHEPYLTFGELQVFCKSLTGQMTDAIALYKHQPATLSSIAEFLGPCPEAGKLAVELASCLPTIDAMQAATALIHQTNQDVK